MSPIRILTFMAFVGFLFAQSPDSHAKRVLRGTPVDYSAGDVQNPGDSYIEAREIRDSGNTDDFGESGDFGYGNSESSGFESNLAAGNAVKNQIQNVTSNSRAAAELIRAGGTAHPGKDGSVTVRREFTSPESNDSGSVVEYSFRSNGQLSAISTSTVHQSYGDVNRISTQVNVYGSDNQSQQVFFVERINHRDLGVVTAQAWRSDNGGANFSPAGNIQVVSNEDGLNWGGVSSTGTTVWYNNSFSDLQEVFNKSFSKSNAMESLQGR